MTEDLQQKITEVAESKSKNEVPQSELDKIKEENDAMEKELMRREDLRAKQMNAGRAMGGQIIPEKTKEELANEEAKKMLSMFR